MHANLQQALAPSRIVRAAWICAIVLLVPGVQGQYAQFLLEDPADDNGVAPQGTDLLSMLVEADGRWVNLTVRLDGFPVVKTPYQLDVMPIGWQVYAACTIAPVEGPLAEASHCSGSRIERRAETTPGPAAVDPFSFDVHLELQPNDNGFAVGIPYEAFVNVENTPIEVVRATSGNGATVTDSFVYPDRADIARAETEWWMPLLAVALGPEVQTHATENSARKDAAGPAIWLFSVAVIGALALRMRRD